MFPKDEHHCWAIYQWRPVGDWTHAWLYQHAQVDSRHLHPHQPDGFRGRMRCQATEVWSGQTVLTFYFSGPFLFVPNRIHIKGFQDGTEGVWASTNSCRNYYFNHKFVKCEEKANCFMLSSCCPWCPRRSWPEASSVQGKEGFSTLCAD